MKADDLAKRRSSKELRKGVESRVVQARSLLSRALEILEEGETVLQALQLRMERSNED